MNKKKLLKGFDEVHFAPMADGGESYETPIRIHNAKKIESELEYEGDSDWADDKIVDDEYNYAGGEGTLTTLGLDKTEYNTLFNNKIVKGGVVVNSNDIAREGAFLFSRKKKGSKHKRLYVIYACKCSQSGVSAEGIEGGKGPAGEDEINFKIGQNSNGDIFHFIDTDDETADSEAITNWFTKVQMPQDVEILQVDVKEVKAKK
ncbi:major tail protein [Clostridium perfringens]|uniref:major tail protein n=2 Tax=Clostridium perfringens TaxID=1502 RepID=UPI0030D3EEDC